MMRDTPASVDFLILGAGWTSTFLIPQLKHSQIAYAATTTTGHDNTIPFKFDPESEDADPYKSLPAAQTVLITFPLVGKGQSLLLTHLYHQTHKSCKPNWIQLGTTFIYTSQHWSDNESSYDKTSQRAIAEDELRENVQGVSLNLSGLYGGSRDPKNFVTRVATTKEQVQKKQAVHFIHGEDLARAIVAMHNNFTPGKRWLLTDLRVYDWWHLFYAWGPEARKRAKTSADTNDSDLDYQRWVEELMNEEGVRALPRDTGSLGRVLDSRSFWKQMGIVPMRGLLS